MSFPGSIGAKLLGRHAPLLPVKVQAPGAPLLPYTGSSQQVCYCIFVDKQTYCYAALNFWDLDPDSFDADDVILSSHYLVVSVNVTIGPVMSEIEACMMIHKTTVYKEYWNPLYTRGKKCQDYAGSW